MKGLTADTLVDIQVTADKYRVSEVKRSNIKVARSRNLKQPKRDKSSRINLNGVVTLPNLTNIHSFIVSITYCDIVSMYLSKWNRIENMAHFTAIQ